MRRYGWKTPPFVASDPMGSLCVATRAQVASLDALLGLKLSAVGQIDASAAKRLEDATMEQHPLLLRAEKALSFLLRFAGDAHLDCFGESIADWLAPAADGDE